MTNTEKGTQSKRPDLKKEVQTKEDGRLLIFYNFDDNKKGSSAPEKKQETRS